MKVLISGVSRGLGKALAEKYLKTGCDVIGIGRSHEIGHPSFRFIQCDLSDPLQVNVIDFGQIDEETILINNAGIIGNIRRISDQQKPDASVVMQVNTVAPMLLCSKIARAVSPTQMLTVVNISSGAGRRPIPSWSAYCASKAALDMFSQTFLLEEIEKGRKISVFSIAPGVIDTEMQQAIRSAGTEDFSSLSRFEELKSNDQLVPPDEVVDRLIDFIRNSNESMGVVCSL